MIVHPEIDPVALALGPLKVHWYGLMYLAAFVAFWWLGNRRIVHQPFVRTPWTSRDVEDILFLGVMGVVMGGRLGYCLFYMPGYYASHPLEIFYIWQGGMSFHGGLLGVFLALVWFAHSRKRLLLQVADFVVPCVPTGLMFGRIGNFINGELWGRVASDDVPWAMVFRGAGHAARHPSQLYQAVLEGLLLFVVLWIYARKPRRLGQVAAAFLAGYGVLRFIVEYFREPDAHLGVLGFGMTMGQWLCLPMVASGVGLWLWAQYQPNGAQDASGLQR